MAALSGILALAHIISTTPPPAPKRGWLCLVKNSKEALKISQYINIFQKSPGTAAEATPETLIWLDYQKAYFPMRAQPSIVIMPEILSSLPVDNPEHLRITEKIIQVKEKLNPETITVFLQANSYSREKSCAQEQTFAIIGDTLYIWIPYQKYPIRIVFDGNIVESIEEIHPETKKITARKTLLEIPALAATKAKSIYTIRNIFAAHEIISLNDNTDYGSAYRVPNFYASDQKKLQTDSKLWRNFQIIVATEQPAKTKQLLPTSTLLPFFTQEIGFINPSQKIVFLTDRHLFGTKEQQPSLKKTKQMTRLDDLLPGMHVVHLYHGIGKYSGMQKMSINGHEREYIKIEYAGNDKLFVPVDQLDRIERYIGSENPRLHPLSGNNWLETLHLVKANTLQLAKELLEHYAKRTLARAPDMIEHSEEADVAASFPFELTADQKTALQAIYRSLAQAHPVDHLLCGDVGFGKTELAIRAAVRAVLNGYQVIILAPTTILAQQHYDTFRERLKHLPINIHLLSRWQKPTQQKKITAAMATGTTDIIIGTHRLLSKDIRVKKLGLVIIDEEQRFGIGQKEKLSQLAQNIHTLHLSATPIPRTLHLSLSGMRPISYIQTPPTGRKEIKTFVKPASDGLIKQAIEYEITRNGQVYLLHNHVQSINRRAQEIQQLLPNIKIGIAHGQMEDKQLAEVMHAFDTRAVDVLLCSTIIENGLDLPNVNTLIVENATQFGLSQLYQLRGRIGRGDRQAFAYFLYSAQKMTTEARLRLQAIEEAVSLGAGLELARRDMEIRGVGSILGKKQHGHATAIGLNLYTRLLNQAVEEIRTGKEPEAIRDITIDLPLDAVIPQQVEHDATNRLNLYRRLANIQNLEELYEERNRLRKRFSQPAVENIFSLLELKLLAQASIITSIDTVYTDENEVDNTKKSPKIIIKTMERIPSEKINAPWIAAGDFQIKTLQKKLGKNWLAELKDIVKKLQK